MLRKDFHAEEPGHFELSTAKDVSLYSIEVWKNGGFLTIYNGLGRTLFHMPSIFTGSFVLEGHSESGLYIRLGAGAGIVPSVTITWLESE